MHYRKYFFVTAFLALLSAAGFGQVHRLAEVEIVAGAAARREYYIEAFKNLISEERKTFEIYDNNGSLKKRRTIDSVFLVYPLSKKEGAVTEFRNVTAVDGKLTADSDKRAADFFEEVASSDNISSEQGRIRKESSRFDEDFAIDGLTLFPAVALSKELQPFFRFSYIGKTYLDGAEVYLIEYEQSRASSSITVNSKSKSATNNYDVEIDKQSPELNARIRGSLWVDVATFNLRKEHRERTINPGGFAAPMIVAIDIFEYSDSEHGILTPRRIEHIQNRVFLKERSVRKDTRILLEYGKFTRPDVEVRSSEVKGDKP